MTSNTRTLRVKAKVAYAEPTNSDDSSESDISLGHSTKKITKRKTKNDTIDQTERIHQLLAQKKLKEAKTSELQEQFDKEMADNARMRQEHIQLTANLRDQSNRKPEAVRKRGSLTVLKDKIEMISDESLKQLLSELQTGNENSVQLYEMLCASTTRQSAIRKFEIPKYAQNNGSMVPSLILFLLRIAMRTVPGMSSDLYEVAMQNIFALCTGARQQEYDNLAVYEGNLVDLVSEALKISSNAKSTSCTNCTISCASIMHLFSIIGYDSDCEFASFLHETVNKEEDMESPSKIHDVTMNERALRRGDAVGSLVATIAMLISCEWIRADDPDFVAVIEALCLLTTDSKLTLIEYFTGNMPVIQLALNVAVSHLPESLRPMVFGKLFYTISNAKNKLDTANADIENQIIEFNSCIEILNVLVPLRQEDDRIMLHQFGLQFSQYLWNQLLQSTIVEVMRRHETVNELLNDANDSVVVLTVAKLQATFCLANNTDDTQNRGTELRSILMLVDLEMKMLMFMQALENMTIPYEELFEESNAVFEAITSRKMNLDIANLLGYVTDQIILLQQLLDRKSRVRSSDTPASPLS